MNLFTSEIMNRVEVLCKEISRLPRDIKIETINKIKMALHKVSPFSNEPVDCVIWEKANNIKANDYNPNKVAPPEMKLLKHSIKEDGYTQPIVTFDQGKNKEVIDGFHRCRVGKECKEVTARIYGYLPITIIKQERIELKDRIAATIRHNRARGVHGVIPMVDIVAVLVKKGWTDVEIAKELGMGADEVLRFKQNSGLPELFKNHDYSKSWE